MTDAIERRAACKVYQKMVDDLDHSVFGEGAEPGLKLRMNTVEEKMKWFNIKINIFITLQSATLLTIVTLAIRVVFYGLK